jgi:hypothetical protein
MKTLAFFSRLLAARRSVRSILFSGLMAFASGVPWAQSLRTFDFAAARTE